MESLSQHKITLPEIIKVKLRELNWNQALLAERSGVSPPVISRLLNGAKNISVENITKILATLSILNVGLKSGVPEKAWADTKPKGYTNREIQRMEDLAAANKRLNEYLEKENKQLNQKIKELENEVQVLKKRWINGRRQGDPAELDVAVLRKQSEKEK
ncbi:MAG: helix-turn-helix domain-containing protein [Methanosarcinaceae archaeon]|nr:helix-turn-helix domain-containing protein [Methanosarcinaceae archaeon]